ncbi:hypothetical protein [Prauserella marina]|uniref:hypothetical protein n=1 Tax=Prauserella marina TaxID=530584 RepID=UPI00115FCC3C|nr:hypothetical protein [Prauserella marina]
MDGLLADFRRRYPDALAVCAQMADRRGSEGVEWPEWCWLPMAGVVAYLADKGQPNGEIGKVAALTAWRLGRGVYELDADVSATSVIELWNLVGGAENRARAVLPGLDAWSRLPEWCCYVRWPDAARLPDTIVGEFHPRGVFVHLEYDMNTARPELRLVIDTDGTWDNLTPIPIYLDRPTMGSAVADVEANTRASARGARGANAHSLTGPSSVAAFPSLAAWQVLPLVLSLIDPAVEHIDPTAPGDRPRRAQRRPQGWRPAPATRLWSTTYTTRPKLTVVQ